MTALADAASFPAKSFTPPGVSPADRARETRATAGELRGNGTNAVPRSFVAALRDADRATSRQASAEPARRSRTADTAADAGEGRAAEAADTSAVVRSAASPAAERSSNAASAPHADESLETETNELRESGARTLATALDASDRGTRAEDDITAQALRRSGGAVAATTLRVAAESARRDAAETSLALPGAGAGGGAGAAAARAAAAQAAANADGRSGGDVPRAASGELRAGELRAPDAIAPSLPDARDFATALRERGEASTERDARRGQAAQLERLRTEAASDEPPRSEGVTAFRLLDFGSEAAPRAARGGAAPAPGAGPVVTADVVSREGAAPTPAQSQRLLPDSLPASNDARVLDQVRILLHQHGGRARLSLSPPELGRLGITVRVTDAQVQLELAADRLPIAELLARHLPELQQALASHGLQIDRATVEHRGADLGGEGTRTGDPERERSGSRHDAGREPSGNLPRAAPARPGWLGALYVVA